MDTLTYSQKLRNPKWQKKRLEVLQRDKFTCQLCLDTETELQIHHKEYNKGCEPWEYENNNLVTVCKHCHVFVSKCGNYPHQLIKKIADGDTRILCHKRSWLNIKPWRELFTTFSCHAKGCGTSSY